MKPLIKNNNRNIEVESVLQLPFKSQTFDTVSAWDVIEHLPEGQESKMFSEIARCLHSEEILLLFVPCNEQYCESCLVDWSQTSHQIRHL